MPIVRIPVGRRVFAPPWSLTLIVLALGILFIGLGRWQWHRAEQSEHQHQEFARGANVIIPLGALGLDDLQRFQRVRIHGRYQTERQFLLDNQTHQGEAGYQVLTPFVLDDGRTVIVDRGWVPFSGYRRHLPDVSFSAPAPLSVVGRVARLPSVGLSIGRAPPQPGASWPKVTSFPHMSDLSAALGRPLQQGMVLLDPHATHGYVRDWHAPGLPTAQHWSYALQWWSFAVVLVVIWVILSLSKKRQPA